jgi:hypothetical protein
MANVLVRISRAVAHLRGTSSPEVDPSAGTYTPGDPEAERRLRQQVWTGGGDLRSAEDERRRRTEVWRRGVDE